MEAADKDIAITSCPNAIAPPICVQESTETIELWTGKADLTQTSASQTGDARVYVDTLPRPIIRFEFQADSNYPDKTGLSQLRQVFQGEVLKSGELVCDPLLGRVAVNPTNSTGTAMRGVVHGWISKPKERFSSAKFLVINGPSVRGKTIRRANAAFVGRLQNDTGPVAVTIDCLTSKTPSARSVFGFTHVAEIRFNQPQDFDQFERVSSILFNTLSLMRGGWVGLVGPWLYENDGLRVISTEVTKTSRNSRQMNWCDDSIPDVFEKLFPCLQAAFDESERREALQTGLHWLIESQQCAGGVEGSLVLQQAALEALAWFEIVQFRKLCSYSGFESLPAADKIRWFASLRCIPTSIPPQYTELVNYARAHPQIDDLPGLLVDVRNALVHGSPKKVRRLLERPRGDDERTDLWWLITGILEQAVLAVSNYRGMILRREIDTQLAVAAVRQVPWV